MYGLTLVNVNWLRTLPPFVSSNPKPVRVPTGTREIHTRINFPLRFQLIPQNELMSGGCSVHSPLNGALSR